MAGMEEDVAERLFQGDINGFRLLFLDTKYF